MGYPNRSWQQIIIIIYMICSLSSMFVHCSNSYDPEALDALIHSYTDKRQESTYRTGTLYKVYLPGNFSGMEASVVRLRSSSFWGKGANFSSFYIPPKVLTTPYAKRISLVYENLGNWSSLYYQLPAGLSLVSPVLGLTAYDASNSSAVGDTKLNFSIMDDHPISISFPIVLPDKNATPKCATFGADGSIDFMTNMIKPNECVTRNQGHFAIVVKSDNKKEDRDLIKYWWVFVLGFLGFVLLILIGVLSFKVVRRKKIRDMEKQSENSVPVDTVWIGGSKMPSASMIRTQPALEYGHAP